MNTAQRKAPDMPEYGTVEWLEREYKRSASDPWGLSWRPTQMFRYACMTGAVRRFFTQQQRSCDTVVDVGCATGDFTDLLRRLLPVSIARRVVGIDLSNTAIERAQRRYPDTEFHCGGFDDAAARFPGTADLVCCLEVLYYLPAERRAAALDALHSTLRPGGLLLVSSVIGKGPYISQRHLTALVEKRFTVVSSSCLTLWPLVVFEKAILKLKRSDLRVTPQQFMPGSFGFGVMSFLTGLCRIVFRKKAQSHTYVLAVRA